MISRLTTRAPQLHPLALADEAARLADERISRRLNGVVCAALIALTALVFAQTVDHDFLGYDDPFYVTDNPIVQRGLTWEGVRWAFSRSYEAGGTYAPFTFLTHMLDCQLYGPRPGGHHLTNVLLHAANSVALYLSLLALTGGRWPSALAAALFAVHPLRAESVAWVAERKDLVCGFFFMLCLWTYAGYARRPGVGRYLLVILALALGLMSKPMLVTVPALLLLLDYWPLKRAARWKALVIEKVPMVVMSLATAALTIATQRSAGFVRTLDQFPLEFRISNTIVSYARYVGKTIWPFNLASFYPPPAQWGTGTVLSCALLLVAITVASVAARRRSPYLAVGWFWFLGTLVPVIGLVQVGRQAMADRYSYIPHIGLFIMIAWSAAALAARSELARKAVVAVTCGLTIAFAVRAGDQTRHWKNTTMLFAHAMTVTRENAVTLNQVGNAKLRQTPPDLATAEALYRRAIDLEPEYGMAHLNLGNLLARRREFDQGAEHFEAAIRWRPTLARAHMGLGIARTGLRQYDLADESFREALRLAPHLSDAQTAWDLSRKQRAATTAPTTRGASSPV